MTSQPSDLTLIGASGTHRRLQALAAAGWPTRCLGTELGAARTRVPALLREHRVTVRTARRVSALYVRLASVDPATRGARPEEIARAKARAAAARWAPASAWDDDSIDDPTATPEWTGHCGTARGVALHEKHGIPICPPCQGAITRRRLRNETHRLRALSTARA